MDILDELWNKRHPDDVLFLEIINGYKILKLITEPSASFYNKNDILLITVKNNCAWIHDKLIYYQFDRDMIKIKSLLSNHLNINVIFIQDVPYYDIKPIIGMLSFVFA